MPRLAAAQAAKVDAAKDRVLGRDTIGQLTDKLYQLRDEKRALESKVAEIEAVYKEAEARLFEKLESEGSSKGSGKLATCSVSISEVPTAEDWDAIDAYVKKTGFVHLFQRRLSAPAVRELLGTKKAVPGVKLFSVKKLSITAA